MTNYKELIERLHKSHKDYGEGRTQNFFQVCLDCKEAANAIEALTNRLTMAQQERDVVTKRMIELEQELAQVKAERDAAVKCLEEGHACETCKHMDTHPDCEVDCLRCKEDCQCRECRDGSNFKWKGAKEET